MEGVAADTKASDATQELHSHAGSDHEDARSVTSLSVGTGGLEVDLGETFLQISSSGEIDINMKRSQSPPRSPHAGGSRHEDENEDDDDNGVDDYLKTRGFDPNVITRAAELAADSFYKRKESLVDEEDEEDRAASKQHDELAERLNRLEQMLEEEITSEPYRTSPVPSPTHSRSLRTRMDRIDRLLDVDAMRSESRDVADEEEEGDTLFDEADSTGRFRSPKDDVNYSSYAPSDSDAWIRLNRALERAGFNSVPLTETGVPDPLGLYAEVREVLVQYEKRGQVIEELSISSSTTKKMDERVDEKLQKSKRENARLEMELRTLENRIQEMEQDHKLSHQGDNSQLRKLHQENVALQQKLSLSEHRVKAKEAVLERLQKKLEDQVKRQDSQKEKSRSVFEEIEHRAPRPSSVKDQKMLEVIKAFEEEREQMKQEQDLLNAEVRRLNKALQDKENILNGSKRSELDSLERRLMERAQSIEQEKHDSEALLDQREHAVVHKFQKLEQQLSIALSEKDQLEDSVANLKLELSSRPTMRDWKASQRRIAKLETQLQTAVEALEEQEIEEAARHDIFIPQRKRSMAPAPTRDHLSTRERVELMANRVVAEKQDNHKKMSTKELIRRDKMNYKLGLNSLTALPKVAAHEILQDVCRILELSDVELIVPAIQKMCWLIRAMPKLEQFVKEVSGFVMLHGDEITTNQNHATNEDPSMATMQAVMPQLKRWVNDIRKLNTNRTLRDKIVKSLEKSESMKQQQDGSGVLGDSGITGNISAPLTDSQIVRMIQDLLELEETVMRGKNAYQAAEQYVKENPEVLVNRCMTHFLQLFSIRSMDGALPKMNELYVFANEMTNFLKVLRPMIGLSPRASVHTCISKIQEIALEKPQQPDSNTAAVNLKKKQWYLPQWQDK